MPARVPVTGVLSECAPCVLHSPADISMSFPGRKDLERRDLAPVDHQLVSGDDYDGVDFIGSSVQDLLELLGGRPRERQLVPAYQIQLPPSYLLCHPGSLSN